MKKIILALIFTGLFGIFCFAQEPLQQPIVIRGQISQINFAASTITVRWLQTQGYVSYDEITLYVGPQAQITKGGSQIGYTQLQIGDQLEARYIDAGLNGFRLLSLNVVS